MLSKSNDYKIVLYVNLEFSFDKNKLIYKASNVMVKGESFKFKYCLGFWIFGAYFDMIRQGHCVESIVSFRVQNIYISYSMKIECS